MRTGLAALSLLLATATSHIFTQTSAQSPPAGPTFEVVSIKRNTAGQLGSTVNLRPDGGFTMSNVPAGTLIARAYSPVAPVDMAGLPGWAMSERYDVSATSSLSQTTQADRTAMLRAMLADRFKLAVHVEKREQPAFDLVLARSDGRLGPGISPIASSAPRRTDRGWLSGPAAAGAARRKSTYARALSSRAE